MHWIFCILQLNNYNSQFMLMNDVVTKKIVRMMMMMKLLIYQFNQLVKWRIFAKPILDTMMSSLELTKNRTTTDLIRAATKDLSYLLGHRNTRNQRSSFSSSVYMKTWHFDIGTIVVSLLSSCHHHHHHHLSTSWAEDWNLPFPESHRLRILITMTTTMK